MEESVTTKASLAKQHGFTEADFEQINALEISLDKIEGELLLFHSGIPKIMLERPATIKDGILKLTADAFEKYSKFFDTTMNNLKLTKFVPASGAASRMFKFLNEFLNEFDHENETINAYINRKKDKNLSIFLAGIEKFPFYDEIKEKIKSLHPDYHSLERHEKSYRFIKIMLDHNHFDFANKPKGTLAFHKYITHVATPVEEHLNECAFYASSNLLSYLNFKIS